MDRLIEDIEWLELKAEQVGLSEAEEICLVDAYALLDNLRSAAAFEMIQMPIENKEV